MFRKKKYVEEESGLSLVAKGIICLAIIVGMLIVAWKIGDWVTEQDMMFQYGEVVEVD